MIIRIIFIVCAMLIASCHTTAQMTLPPGTSLTVNDRPVNLDPQSKWETTPFSWGNAGGISYKLVKNGQTIDEGKLKSKFRVVSIFWPPVGIAYWPIGFGLDAYDFTHPDASQGIASKRVKAGSASTQAPQAPSAGAIVGDDSATKKKDKTEKIIKK